MIYLAAFTFLGWFVVLIDIFLHRKDIKLLKDIIAPVGYKYPKVSIIVAARNEEKNIEEALKSVLNLDYPDYEVIVVNDRSDDATGEILNKISLQYPKLKTILINSLPKGWLGKINAMQNGAAISSGELVLFTDADIVYQPDALAKAVYYMKQNNISHLVTMPDIVMQGVLLNMFLMFFAFAFNMYFKPWLAKNPKSKRYVGIGAFNLVEKKVFDAIGGFNKVRMRPDDDVKLGKIIKHSGYSQELISGRDYVSVEWYSSVKEAVNGLNKNSFAGVGYSPLLTIGSAIALLLFAVLPFIAVFFTSGITQLFYICTLLCVAGVYMLGSKFHEVKVYNVIGFPLAALIFVYTICKSMFDTYRRNGIEWRGTVYSLKELKENDV